jgi:hypothetical protein
MISNIDVNHTCTPLTDELLESLDKEVRHELLDIIDKIEFVKNLSNYNRKRAKDLEKDKDGKIEVDITNPHILEDTDYFRPLAIQFQKTGRYTDLFPNPSKTSEYRKFWDEQRRRCKYGYVRESDGEWVPGSFYFYLNFVRMDIPVERKDSKGKDGAIAAERVFKHPDFWDGDYLYFHYLEQAKIEGLHGNVLKTRGRGYSEKGGALLAEGYFFWNRSVSYGVASSEDYLIGDGLLTKTWKIIDDVNKNTPFKRTATPKQPMKRVASYIDKEGNFRGANSTVIGISLKNAPEKHRGKRGRRMLFEESGVFPHLKKSWDIARNSFEQDDLVYGQMVAFGTGGSKGNDFEAAKEFIYKPDGYGIKSLRNVYDKTSGKGLCSFWSPVYLNTMKAYDKNGNSDVIKALIRILKKRWKEIKSGVTSDTIMQRKAENAITPQEAILRSDSSLFPVADVKDYNAEVKSNYSKFVSSHYTGLMGIENGQVVFKQDMNKQPIRKYPVSRESDRSGAVEIFDMPKAGIHELNIGDRYIIGIDPVRYDEANYSISLASAFVFDLWLDQIVAEYTCRPNLIDDFNEQVRRLSKYYNAVIGYENDVTDLFTYFKNNNELIYLGDTPEILKSMEIVKEGRGNRSKGIPSGVKLNNQLRLWLSQWLKEKPPFIGNDEEDDKTIMNLHGIRSIGLLDELELWNPDGNFDRVSAMGIVMALRKDKIANIESKMSQDIDTPDNDPFFKENYNGIYGNSKDFQSFGFDEDSLDIWEKETLNFINK